MIIAVDPGSQKTGIALVQKDGALVKKAIIPSAMLEEMLVQWLQGNDVSAVAMGNGTRHEVMKERIEKALQVMGSTIPVELVNEKYTTEMGEQRYWKDHPAKGLSRWIPQGFRTVPEPVDDYVAWIIGQIYLGLIQPEAVGHKKV